PDPQVCAMHEATTAEQQNLPLVNPTSACCIVNGGVCKIKTTLLLRPYPTRRHTMRSAANCTRTRELRGFFSRRMSSLRKRSRPSPSRADTSACRQGPAPRPRARRPPRHGQGTRERVSYASPFVRYFPRFEGPDRRRRPGGQGASYDVPGVIWSRVGGCNPSRHGCSYTGWRSSDGRRAHASPVTEEAPPGTFTCVAALLHVL